MPRKFRPATDYHQTRFTQISESHCGPAVVQMLLSNLGIEVSQEAIAEAGGATSLIELNGMRVDQLALAVQRLAPLAQFYYKDHSTLDELVRIVNDYRYPVGVEWQGEFEDEPAEAAPDAGLLPDSESEENDYGHYSLVIRADRRRKLLIIADPYKDYVSQDRIFSFAEFEGRWWDYNEHPNPAGGSPILIQDYRMMFVVTRANVLFPARMGLKTYPDR